MTNATMKIIEAMVSNAYNGIRGKMILKKPTRVHQVKVSSSNTTIHQKLDVLAKQMETLMKAQIQMMTNVPPPLVCNQCGETCHT